MLFLIAKQSMSKPPPPKKKKLKPRRLKYLFIQLFIYCIFFKRKKHYLPIVRNKTM